MWKVGHSLIKAKMKEEHADLAGEMSGHMFFAERWFGFDDAVYAGMRLVELLTRSKQSLAELYDTLPVLYNTPEIRMTCPDDVKFEVVKRAQDWFRERHEIVDIDGVRVLFKENGKQGANVGWGLVRASNTGPVLVLRFEADSNDRLAEIKALVEGRLAQIMSDVGAPPPKLAAH
jgi:phosphomannomutase/phosphoglucomutase